MNRNGTVYCTLGLKCPALNPRRGTKGDDGPLDVEHWTCTRERYLAFVEREALRVLVATSTDRWRAVLGKATGSVDTARLRRAVEEVASNLDHREDIAAEVFERLHHALEHHGLRASSLVVKAWLRRTTYRRALRCSRGPVRDRLGIGGPPDDPPPSATPCSARVDRREFHRDVVTDDILNKVKLSALERDTYERWRASDESAVAMAENSGCTARAIRLRVHKATRKVLAVLREAHGV